MVWAYLVKNWPICSFWFWGKQSDCNFVELFFFPGHTDCLVAESQTGGSVQPFATETICKEGDKGIVRDQGTLNIWAIA